jgi:hypothetical protein
MPEVFRHSHYEYTHYEFDSWHTADRVNAQPGKS